MLFQRAINGDRAGAVTCVRLTRPMLRQGPKPAGIGRLEGKMQLGWGHVHLFMSILHSQCTDSSQQPVASSQQLVATASKVDSATGSCIQNYANFLVFFHFSILLLLLVNNSSQRVSRILGRCSILLPKHTAFKSGSSL